MMGRLSHDQGEFFYSFRLDEAVPDDHPVRAIAAGGARCKERDMRAFAVRSFGEAPAIHDLPIPRRGRRVPHPREVCGGQSD